MMQPPRSVMVDITNALMFHIALANFQIFAVIQLKPLPLWRVVATYVHAFHNLFVNLSSVGSSTSAPTAAAFTLFPAKQLFHQLEVLHSELPYHTVHFPFFKCSFV